MPTDRRRPLADVLGSRTRNCTDLADIAAAVCAVVDSRIPYDFGCLATLDPLTGLISWAYKSRPLDIGDEEFATAEYGGGPDVNQFAEIATRPDPVGVLSIDTAGEPEKCRRFRDFLVPRFGFTDELRVVFRTQGLTWGALAVYRGAGDPPFTGDDARTAVSVQTQVAELIRRALFHPRRPAADAAPGPSVIVLDADDRVTNMTPAAAARIEELGGWDNGSLPSTVLVTCAAARSTPELATTRAVGRDGAWLVVRAATFAPPPSSAGFGPRGDVVVTIETASPGDISALALAAHGLSPREQEVAALVLQGVATKGIAESLHLSPHTVQDSSASWASTAGGRWCSSWCAAEAPEQRSTEQRSQVRGMVPDGRRAEARRMDAPTASPPAVVDPTLPHALNQLWCEAFNAGDLPALMATYEPEAVIVPGPGAAPLRGHAAIEGALTWFLGLGGKLRFTPRHWVEQGDLALASIAFTMDGATDADGRPVELHGVTSEVLRRQPDGSWRYLVDHPFGGSD